MGNLRSSEGTMYDYLLAFLFLTYAEHCKMQLTVHSYPLEAHTCPGSWMVLVNRDGDLGKERAESQRTNVFLPRCPDEMQAKALMSQSHPVWTSNLSRHELSNLVFLLLVLLSFVSFISAQPWVFHYSNRKLAKISDCDILKDGTKFISF